MSGVRCQVSETTNEAEIIDLAKISQNTTINIEKNRQYYLLEKLLRSTQTIEHKTKITLEENSRLVYFLALFGGKKVVKEVEVILKGQNSSAKILGVYLGSGSQSYHFKVISAHEGSNTQALTWINGVVMDESKSDFDGMVKIIPGIHQVNSYLANHVLVIGDKAQANAIPSLEIESNDVKCSHEATIGQLDESQLFYLMSRGLDRDEATKLLINGFFESVMSKIENNDIRKMVRREISQSKNIALN